MTFLREFEGKKGAESKKLDEAEREVEGKSQVEREDEGKKQNQTLRKELQKLKEETERLNVMLESSKEVMVGKDAALAKLGALYDKYVVLRKPKNLRNELKVTVATLSDLQTESIDTRKEGRGAPFGDDIQKCVMELVGELDVPTTKKWRKVEQLLIRKHVAIRKMCYKCSEHCARPYGRDGHCMEMRILGREGKL
ncbi:hypothetical protein LSH36_125g07039 [Paralvinella palmiformis]|uniref:Uncharacterized protein n=1 Tax=Paralvinella palmiformis TaxID=53620 RepID=A0AAD9NAD8_9ANNE|nr:hypothetical protein LSH36_125g07039 [Paralvinella palmiformis]